MSGKLKKKVERSVQGSKKRKKESQNIEFKQSWHDDYLKWICGFANAQGGRIFIGKDDTGNITGLTQFVCQNWPIWSEYGGYAFSRGL